MNSDFLGKEKVSSLLMKQTIPAMLGMFVMSLYNVVDTIYIGRIVGTTALAGVSISIPIVMFLLAVSMTIGIGSASIFSRTLGEGNLEKTKTVLGNYFFLIFVSSIIITGIGYIFLDQILYLFGATEEIFIYAFEYSLIMLLGSIFFIYISSSNNIIRAAGNAKLAMLTMIIGALVNLILDPIFIYYLNMGVKGAAYATLISWIIGSLYITYYFIKINKVKILFKDLVPNNQIIKEVFLVGASSFARQGSMSLMTIVVNFSLATYGSGLAIAAFGIISRTMMLAMMPLFGLVQGMQPIIGYNWGAKNFSRVKELLILSLRMSTFFSVFSFFIILVFSVKIISLFSKDAELIFMTNKALVITMFMFPLVGLQLVSGGLYQALGRAKIAFVLSIIRQGIFLIPLVLILPMYFDLLGIWYAFPLADLLAFFVTYYYISKEFKILNKLIA